MTRSVRTAKVFEAIRRILPEIEAALLEHGRAELISVRDHLAIRQLLDRRPELLESDRRIQLGLAIAAILSRSAEEAVVIERAWKNYRAPPEPSGAWERGIVATTIAALLAAVAYSAVNNEHLRQAAARPASTHPARAEPSAVKRRATKAKTSTIARPKIAAAARAGPRKIKSASAAVSPVSLERRQLPLRRWRVETLKTSTTAAFVKKRWVTRTLTVVDAVGAVAGSILVGLGILLMSLRFRPQEEPERGDQRLGDVDIHAPEKEAQYRSHLRRYDRQRRERYIARDEGLSRQRPVPWGAMVESGGVLGRLCSAAEGRTLDGERTAEATSASGGMYAPRLEQRQHPKVLLILVDVEAGDHVWLGAIRRVILDWVRLGVAVEVFQFKINPRRLEATKTGARFELDPVAKAHPDAPILLISRRIDRDVGDAQLIPDWVPILKQGRTCAWLDPEPAPPTTPRARQIRAFEGAGLTRFPLTASGLVAVAHFLVTEGQSTDRPAWPPWPDPSAPELQPTLKRWATAALLVPEATWDNIETVRQHPEIRPHFPTRAHAAVLLSWMARHPGFGVAGDVGAGSGLDVPDNVVTAWRAKQRRLDPEWERYWTERWVDVLEQEEREAPDDEDDRKRDMRRLRLVRHYAYLGRETSDGIALFLGTLVHREAQRDWKQLMELGVLLEAPPKPVEPPQLLISPWSAMVGATAGSAVCLALILLHRIEVSLFSVAPPRIVVVMPDEFQVSRGAPEDALSDGSLDKRRSPPGNAMPNNSNSASSAGPAR